LQLLLLSVGETGDVNNMVHGSMLQFLDVEQPSENYRSEAQGMFLFAMRLMTGYFLLSEYSCFRIQCTDSAVVR